MKAFQLTGLRKIEARQVADPGPPGEGDVLVRVECVGVCGSDVHYYTDGKIGSQIVEYPFTIGHEFAGVIEAVGPRVTRVRAGDRVAIDPAMPCFDCDQCRAGRHHTCRNLRFLGCPGQAEGCLSERIVMPRTSCFPIPADMTFEQAAIVEPLSIGIYAASLASPLAGKTVGILGAGPIGLCTMMAARASGAEKIVVTDKIDERLRAASSLGACWTGNATCADSRAELDREFGGLIDIVFECCGQQEALDQAAQLLKPGGMLLLVGIPETNRISFDINVLRRNELTVRNVRRQNQCMERAIEMVTSGEADADQLITHRFRFEEAPEAFDIVAGYRDGVIKAMIDVN